MSILEINTKNKNHQIQFTGSSDVLKLDLNINIHYN